MLAPVPRGCGRSGLSLRFHHPPIAISPDRQPNVRQRTGGEGAALREKQVRSCWGWNEEAAEEKPVRSQGSSRWEIATERRSGGQGQGSRLATSHPRACSQILQTPHLKEERKQEHWGGMRRRGHGPNLSCSPGTFPPRNCPWDPLPTPHSPGDEGSGMGWGRGPRAGLSRAAPLPNKASVKPFTCRSRPAEAT